MSEAVFDWKRPDMSLARLRNHEPVGFDAFMAFLDAKGGEGRYELIDGEIVAMVGGTFNHEQIAANIGFALKGAMDARGCQTLFGGMFVRNAATRDDFTPAPDILVRCGQPLDSQRYVEDPVAIVEVLSPSTYEYDRGFKMGFYKSLPTLAHIALVYQDEYRAEMWERTGDEWVLKVIAKPDDALAFVSLEFRMTLAEAYRGTSIAVAA